MRNSRRNLFPLLCTASSFASLGAYGADSRPNIILVMTDQHSYDLISALGKNPYLSTPNLDRLVNRGISFSNCYVSNPVSVPSRFALMTGASPAQYGVRENDKEKFRNRESDIRTLQASGLGAVFSNSGYDTYYGGKVHLPFATGSSDMFSNVDNYRFQNYFTRDEREILSQTAASIISARTNDKPMLMVLSYLNPHDICAEASEDLDETGSDKQIQTAQTIAQMRAIADATDPSLYPPIPENFDKTTGLNNGIKLPYQTFTNDYWRRYIFIYYRLIELVDSQIGIALDALDQSAIKENTIVVFTSDHGEMAGSHQLRTKNVPYDECQRVPFIISGKGIVTNQKENSAICNGSDLLPTLCDLAGITPPSALYGTSVAPRARGEVSSLPNNRLHFLEGFQSYHLVQNGRYKYTAFTTPPFPEMLIDLANDPLEKNCLVNDPNYASKLEELRGLMQTELNRRNLKLSMIADIDLFLNDPFEYTKNDLHSISSWMGHCLTDDNGLKKSNPVSIVNSPLNYTGYSEGNQTSTLSIELKNDPLGKSVRNQFSPEAIKMGNIYCSALVKFTDVPENSYNHFMAFARVGTEGSKVQENGRLFAVRTSANTFKIGVSRFEPKTPTTDIKFSSKEFQIGQTYLVILKYSYIDNGNGTFKEECSAFMNPSSTQEPTPDAKVAAGTVDAANLTPIQSLALCQGYTRTINSYASPNVIVDDLRIARNWATLFNPSVATDMVTKPILSTVKVTIDRSTGKVDIIERSDDSPAYIYDLTGTVCQIISPKTNSFYLTQKGISLLKVGNQTIKLIF